MNVTNTYVIRFPITIILLLLTILLTHAQSIPHRLDSVFNALDTDGEMSGAFIVVDSGKIVFEKYMGFEDAEKQHSIHPQSRFELASVSKQFTAMAIMQLEEKGKLSFEDDITKYFPKLKFKNVRIKSLLRNTSGIPEFLGFDPQWVDQTKINTNKDILQILETKTDSTSFKAGEAYSYSNTNYLLLALIVEKISGQSFADYMQQNIFQPAGMETSSVFSARSPKANLKSYAKGFAYDAKTKSFKSVDDFSTYSFTRYFDGINGPYGISSTAQDLLKWNQALQKNTLLKRENFLKAIYADTLNNGQLINMSGGLYYGFGWLFTDSTDTADKMHFHTGGYPGYKNIIVRDMKNERCFIALMNKWNTINVLNLTAAVDAVLRGKDVPVIEREELTEAVTLMEFQIKQLLGTYAYTEQPDLKFEITADEEGNLLAQLTGQTAVPVYPKNELELFYTAVKAELKFTKENEQITKLTLFQNGQELEFKKVATTDK